METKVRFRVIAFDHDDEQYILLTHDGLLDQDRVVQYEYGVENIDSKMFEGPKTWADAMLEDIKEALADIEVNYIDGLVSPCYYVEDTRMVCNTYVTLITQFNMNYNAIQRYS